MTTQTASADRADVPSFHLNALLGGVVTLVATPLRPFAPVVGGGLAGYLQRGTTREGARVGAAAGALAAIPTFAVLWFVGASLLLGVVHAFQLASLFGLALLVGVVGSAVALGAIGGFLGAHLRSEL